MSGQSVMDRVTAAKHTVTGSGLAKSVCKATTEEIMGPKKKHLDYLLQCTHEPNINIPQLGELLIDRTNNTSWVIVFKALITSHHLMVYGNERFSQYFASRTNLFNLSAFLDKSGYDMSTYIRRYSKYLNEKALAYRTVAFDFCRAKRGKDDGILRTMGAEKLLKTLPVVQGQLDALLDFECSTNELSNGVINSCFLLLFKDSIRLFACYNDGIINLLEKYFDMTKKQCKEGLDIYRKFLIRMERMSEFLKVAEEVGIDKGEIPDLAKAPSSLLDALEQHLASLEGKKATTTTTRSVNISSQVAASLTQTSNSLASIEAVEKRKALEDEKARLAMLKEQRIKEANQPQAPSPQSSPQIAAAPKVAAASSQNPFTPAPVVAPPVQQPAVQATQQPDLFAATPPQAPTQPTRPSDDLMSLTGNPFAANIAAMQQPAMPTSTANVWGSPNGPSHYPSAGFQANFPTQQQAMVEADGLGDILQPMSTTAQSKPEPKQANLTDADKDLDSTLASLAGSLDINNARQKKTQHQWTKPSSQVRTGGNQWTQAQSVTTWPSQPSSMMSGRPVYGAMGVPGAMPVGGMYPQQQQPFGMMGQPMGMQQMNAFGTQPVTAPVSQPKDPFGNL